MSRRREERTQAQPQAQRHGKAAALTATDTIAEIVAHQVEDVDRIVVGVRAIATLIFALDKGEVGPGLVNPLHHIFACPLQRRAADESFGCDIAENSVRALQEVEGVERPQPPARAIAAPRQEYVIRAQEIFSIGIYSSKYFWGPQQLSGERLATRNELGCL